MFQNELILENLQIPFNLYKKSNEETYLSQRTIDINTEENLDDYDLEKNSRSTKLDYINDFNDSLSTKSFENFNEQINFNNTDFNFEKGKVSKQTSFDDVFYSNRSIFSNEINTKSNLNKNELSIVTIEKNKNSNKITLRKSSLMNPIKENLNQINEEIISKKIVKDKKREHCYKKIRKIKNFWNKNQKSLLQIFSLKKNITKFDVNINQITNDYNLLLTETEKSL